MIKITVSPKKYQVRMKGHAGYDEPGKDIVCASASMVFYNLAQMIYSYDEDKVFCKKPKLEYGSGTAVIEVIPKKEYEAWLQHDFLYACKGFQLLSGNYPEFVSLKVLEY